MPLSAERIIRYERLATPPGHLDVLIEPEPAALRALPWREGGAPCDATRVLDTTLGAVRGALLKQLGLAPPVVLWGHQPAFFHAGVFAKTVATHALARQAGGTAASLSVDSDVPHSSALVIPQQTSVGLRRVAMDIPGATAQQPFEQHPPQARDHWLQFFARLASSYDFHERSCLPDFARAWLTAGGREVDYCDARAAGQATVEASLGLEGVRGLRVSRLCATPAFRVFVAALLLDARRVAELHNGELAAYRRRHRIRAAGRPVPPLTLEPGRIELPLWIGREDGPRHRLHVRERPDAVELLADREEVASIARRVLASAATHDAPWGVEHEGWRIRPRALTLSAFVRLLLSDLFIHGIGGAKYDELMEAWIASWLGAAPRCAGCVSATLRLPLPHHGVGPGDILAARWAARDLRYNPQRHVPKVPRRLRDRRAELVRQSRALAAGTPRDRATRRTVFQEIRRVNEQILEHDPWRAAAYDQRIEDLLERQRLDQIALDRTYFYALHMRATLEALVTRIREALASA
jgi:hypothetical protein